MVQPAVKKSGKSAAAAAAAVSGDDYADLPPAFLRIIQKAFCTDRVSILAGFKILIFKPLLPVTGFA